MKKISPAKPTSRSRVQKKIRAMIELSVKAPASNEQALSSNEDWVELFPYGVSVASSEGRPVLILKDRREESALPVWLHPSALGQGEEAHEFTRHLLAAFKVRVTHCQINEINGHRQYATIYFEGHPTVTSLRVRADLSMSFCLAVKARFYSTRTFMMRCRDVDAEMMKLEHRLVNRPEFGSKTHPYVM